MIAENAFLHIYLLCVALIVFSCVAYTKGYYDGWYDKDDECVR